MPDERSFASFVILWLLDYFISVYQLSSSSVVLEVCAANVLRGRSTVIWLEDGSQAILDRSNYERVETGTEFLFEEDYIISFRNLYESLRSNIPPLSANFDHAKLKYMFLTFYYYSRLRSTFHILNISSYASMALPFYTVFDS